ncbi:RIP metalloprotease RseP [Candidatus Kuenenbacteria bacterium RIFCSPHIGHO2_12_FULL_42_14]|uniref:Zinc metalloprotease n=4 Tax=Candidatus Kueneniibacteriota TaxID=1752740 RepID=A0A1F6GLH7_9BACT|nr:MAG: RIP metalloprotease RseP [Candidatus Kuenenbacteria bacterium RBG_16_41_7]OGG98971.1 MAG: RIP metalloprotease RseP [Candidatus Kuenenbacteria bacterium RIFCSPHIGHO2_12_FULL_42_14]
MFLTVLTFIIILGILVLVHELGHFLTARLFKVKAEEFGFGLPPRIAGWVKNDSGRWQKVKNNEADASYKKTIWSFNWLPIGGFVKIKGEDGEGETMPDSFSGKKIWQRFIILFAGALMNFMLCFLLLSIGFATGIPTMVDDTPAAGLNLKSEKIQIISVAADSPANRSGVQIGDVVKSVNNEPITSIKALQEKINQQKNQATEFVFLRGAEELNKTIKPEELKDAEGRAVIGVGLVKTAIVSYPWYQAIYEGAKNTIGLTVAIVEAFGKIIGDIFAHGKVAAEISGPIGIAVLTGQVVKLGFIYILQFTAMLSLNLAIINLLPIPGLDGGRILFLLFEKIKGRPLRQKYVGLVHQLGFFFLIALIILITYRDFNTYGASILGALKSVF